MSNLPTYLPCLFWSSDQMKWQSTVYVFCTLRNALQLLVWLSLSHDTCLCTGALTGQWTSSTKGRTNGRRSMSWWIWRTSKCWSNHITRIAISQHIGLSGTIICPSQKEKWEFGAKEDGQHVTYTPSVLTDWLLWFWAKAGVDQLEMTRWLLPFQKRCEPIQRQMFLQEKCHPNIISMCSFTSQAPSYAESNMGN